jgi:hypothetical protein
VNARAHARLALDQLPGDPADLRRDDLPTLLAAIQGQRRILEAHRGELLAALAAGDVDQLRELAAQEHDLDVGYQVIKPYRRRAEAMARGGQP